MKNVKKLIGIIIFGMVIISFAAALGKKDTSQPTAPAPAATQEGIPGKLQNTYSAFDSSDTFTIGANSGTLTISGVSQTFDNLNVKDGGDAMSYPPGHIENAEPSVIGDWAYLYTGNTKMGFIMDYGYSCAVFIGLENAQTGYEGLHYVQEGLVPRPDFSDIPDTIPNWDGSIQK